MTTLLLPRRPRRSTGAGSAAPVPLRVPQPVDVAPPSPGVGVARRLLEALVLAALLPLALAAALPIALVNLGTFRDPRKVLFVQPRIGQGGRTFRLMKFRTMRDVAESDFESWSGDPSARVTRFGRLLRNTHLDELPQLVNVLRGDMRLIGPRPEMVEVDAWARGAVRGFERRLALKPGLTGLAQVTQGYTPRAPEAYRRKLALDRLYARRASLRLDLAIVARTVAWMACGRGWSFRR